MRASAVLLTSLLFISLISGNALAGHRSFTHHVDFHPVLADGTEGGTGNVTLVIQVREGNETGRALAGAVVSVLYERHEHATLLTNDGGGGPGEGGNTTSGPLHDHRQIVLETDEGGDATFHVHPDHHVTLTVSKSDGWRREHHEFVTPSAGETTNWLVPMFQARFDAHLIHKFPAGTIEPAAATPMGFGEGGWFPQRVPIHNDTDVYQQYQERIVSIEVQMTWDQHLPNYADLGLAVGNASDNMISFVGTEFPGVVLPGHGVDPVPDPGRHNVRQLLLLGSPAASPLKDGDGIWVGPAIQAPLVLAEELHVDFEVVVFFDLVPGVVELHGFGAPGPSLALVVAAILVAAAAARLSSQRRS